MPAAGSNLNEVALVISLQRVIPGKLEYAS